MYISYFLHIFGIIPATYMYVPSGAGLNVPLGITVMYQDFMYSVPQEDSIFYKTNKSYGMKVNITMLSMYQN